MGSGKLLLNDAKIPNIPPAVSLFLTITDIPMHLLVLHNICQEWSLNIIVAFTTIVCSNPHPYTSNYYMMYYKIVLVIFFQNYRPSKITKNTNSSLIYKD